MPSLKPSYSPNYFSIEDILATQERISCKFEMTVPKLGEFIYFMPPLKIELQFLGLIVGMLDPSADDEDLKQGSKVEVPFWMVPTLFSKKVITFEIPKYYKVNYRLLIE